MASQAAPPYLGWAAGGPARGPQLCLRGHWGGSLVPWRGRQALTQQRGAAVAQRVALVAGDAQRRQGMESPFQQRLQARGRRVRGVEQVVDLLAGGPQLENWGRGEGVESQRPQLAPP